MQENFKKKYFIIGGTNKAATTSFYEYLAAHPEICSSYIKQTFFFLDKEWQIEGKLESLYDYNKGLEQFDFFYRECSSNIINRLEASPEYLYAENTPERLKEFYSEREGKIIFILRNPVTRFISLFYFGKQQGVIDEKMDFESFVNESIKYEGKENSSLQAYQTGFYSKYLKRYYDLFGESMVKTYFFEDLRKDNISFMKKVAADLNIKADFYESYDFESHNKTVEVKNKKISNLYKVIRAKVIKYLFRSKLGYKIAVFLGRKVSKVYHKLNTSEINKYDLDENVINELKMRYNSEKKNLEEILKREVPW